MSGLPVIVPQHVELAIRLDERRRWAHLLAAHDADGNLLHAQRALDALAAVPADETTGPFESMKAKRGVAWLVGELTRIVEGEPDVEQVETLVDRWLAQAVVA